jgi:type I restriction enzyme S subunit
MTDAVGLPRGWAATELGQIRVDLSRTLDPRHYLDEDFELYSVPSFADGEPEIVRGNAIGSAKMTLTPGTVVVCKINPRINRVWVVGDRSSHKKIGSGEWIPFFPVDGVTPHFLAYYLQRDHFRNFLAARVSGVGGSLMRVRPTTLDEYPLPIPSVSEQQRIVEAIESYLTRLDNAVALLERVEEDLKRYRASVLKAAVEGRLVPTEAELARREGRSYEPASELLKRILAERKTHWIEDAAEKARAKAAEKARTAGQPWTARDDAATLEKERAKAAKQYKEPAVPDTTDLPELPEGWCWASAAQVLLDVRNGTTASQSEEEGGLPVSRIETISRSVVDLQRVRYVHDVTAELTARFGLRDGDILLSHINSDTHLGKSAVVTHAVLPLLHGMNLLRLRVRADMYSPRFMHHVLEQLRAAGVFLRIAQHAVNQASINQAKLLSLAVPVAPRTEQERIVSRAEQLLSLAQQTSTAAGREQARCAKLRQSILKWAFEGKLVEQDPSDEPALVLLERIKAEREGAGAPKARGRTKRSTE